MDKRRLIAKIKAKGAKAAQAALADLLEISAVSISKKLNGIVQFKPEEIAKIMDWLDLTDTETVEIFIRRRKGDDQY